MRTVTARQMKKLDEQTIEKFGVPAVCLMENAGRAVADEAVAMLRRVRGKKVLVVCGAGNNGGDGFVAARHLRGRGYDVAILFSGQAARMKEAAAMNFQIVRRLKVRVLCPSAAVLASLARYDLIIDAFYGIGLSSDLQGLCRRIVEAVNGARVPVLAVDVPSGLDATTGRACGIAVRAHRTITLGVAKKGLFIADGPRYAGQVLVADIGIILPLR